MMNTEVPLLLLDIDGTVRHGYDELGKFVNGPDDVTVFPEAVERMQEWKDMGGRIMAVTNQGGVALGLADRSEVKAAMLETHRQANDLFDLVMICFHHPDSDDPMSGYCWCRKPRPGLVITGLFDLTTHFPEFYPPNLALFVGDREEDSECARALGVQFQWATDWREGKS